MGSSSFALRVLIRRALSGLALFLALGLGLFYLLATMPASGEARRRLEDPTLSPAEFDRIRTLYGLDRSVPERLRCWLLGRAAPDCPYARTERGILGGELGVSEVHRSSVPALLRERLPPTLALVVPALVLALLAGIGLGALAAIRGGGVAQLIRGLGAVLVAVPSHVLGLSAIAVFSLWARVLPPGGFGPGPTPDLGHLVLPVMVLSLHFLGRYLRFVETGLQAALQDEHLWAARARGLSEGRVVWVHGLPMVLLPLLPLIAQTLPTLFSGALLVERIFDFPGMGLLIHESILFGDLEVALVLALIYAALTMFASGLADLGHLWLDPRARREETT
jgi:peptide/nickel transport system permease protein